MKTPGGRDDPTSPGYMPEGLGGPGFRELEKGEIRHDEKFKDQLFEALTHWQREYAWALHMAGEWFPDVNCRVDNGGWNFYLIVGNGKRGPERKEKELPLEGYFVSSKGTPGKISFNAFNSKFARAMLLAAFKSAERYWGKPDPGHFGLRMTNP